MIRPDPTRSRATSIRKKFIKRQSQEAKRVIWSAKQKNRRVRPMRKMKTRYFLLPPMEPSSKKMRDKKKFGELRLLEVKAIKSSTSRGVSQKKKREKKSQIAFWPNHSDQHVQIFDSTQSRKLSASSASRRPVESTDTRIRSRCKNSDRSGCCRVLDSKKFRQNQAGGRSCF
jgi:hypothetical protein